MTKLLQQLLEKQEDFLVRLGRAGVFLLISLKTIISPPYKLYPIVKQMHFIGVQSFMLILTCGTFVGMVVALLFYDTLVRFGSVALLGSAVGISLVWELGPMLTALVVIGRAGSATCAEIAVMRNEQQIDALECMAIDPYQYIVAPRIIAALITLPMLTALFIVCGIAGGYFVGVGLFGVSPGSYLLGMYDTVHIRDIFMGTAKSFTFALLMIWIATTKGFHLHLHPAGAFGAEGVSKVTTEAVVLSSIMVFFSDFLVSAIIL